MLTGELIGGALVVSPDGTGKPIVETAMPKPPDGYEMEASWRDDGSRIVQTWTAVPVDGSVDDAVRALADEYVDGMTAYGEGNDRLAQQSAVTMAGIEESKARSRAMGDDVGHIRDTTDHTAERVDEIHQYIFREETD